MIQKKHSSCLSQQSNETKPSTKLVLVSQEPLRYLEFNKLDKQSVSQINLLKKLFPTFPSLKIIAGTLIDVRNEASKHHFSN